MGGKLHKEAMALASTFVSERAALIAVPPALALALKLVKLFPTHMSLTLLELLPKEPVNLCMAPLRPAAPMSLATHCLSGTVLAAFHSQMLLGTSFPALNAGLGPIAPQLRYPS